MARALSMQRSIVPLGDRAKYFEKLRARKEHYKAAGCQFWVFEEAALTGAFIEFSEAPDPATLAAALAEAPNVEVPASEVVDGLLPSYDELFARVVNAQAGRLAQPEAPS